jgi:hypothetical protein
MSHHWSGVEFATDGQSASSSWCRATLWGPGPDFTCSLIWRLLASSCRALCLKRGRVCILQCTKFTGQNPGGLATISYCPIWDTRLEDHVHACISPGTGWRCERLSSPSIMSHILAASWKDLIVSLPWRLMWYVPPKRRRNISKNTFITRLVVRPRMAEVALWPGMFPLVICLYCPLFVKVTTCGVFLQISESTNAYVRMLETTTLINPCQVLVQVHLMTDGQSFSLSWYPATIWSIVRQGHHLWGFSADVGVNKCLCLYARDNHVNKPMSGSSSSSSYDRRPVGQSVLV